MERLGVGEVVGVGVGVGAGVGAGVGDGFGVGVGEGADCADWLSLVLFDFFQISFFPCFVQTKLFPFDFLTCPAIEHDAPSLTAAFVWITGIDIREIERRAMRILWGARTGEFSQGKHRETITLESRIAKALVGSPA